MWRTAPSLLPYASQTLSLTLACSSSLALSRRGLTDSYRRLSSSAFSFSKPGLPSNANMFFL